MRKKFKPSPAALAVLARLKASGRLDQIRREVSAATAVRLAGNDRKVADARRS